MQLKQIENGDFIKSFSGKSGQALLCALVATFLIWGISHAAASGKNDGSRTRQDALAEVALPEGAISPTPTPTATPLPTPPPQIDGDGTIAGPNGRQAQFFILDVEDEQVTNKYLEGEFGYSD